MIIYNLTDFASLYFGGVTPLNFSLDLDYNTWQRLNATAFAFLGTNASASDVRDEAAYSLVSITVVYAIIFIAGVVGNVSTCIVIVQNRCMHTATNYYLFSLAISDLILLLSGLPPEVCRVWYPDDYVFGEASCVFLGLMSEASANATVLTITAFTVERYIAICHPFLSHTMSKLSRVIKFIIAIWLLALCLAIPQAIQYGVVYTVTSSRRESSCTVKWEMIEHAFEISGFLFFVGPMTVITVLYLLIGIRLRTSRLLQSTKRGSLNGSSEYSSTAIARSYRHSVSQSRAIKMLVAVAVSFFLCWAPFHSQRLLAVYGENADEPSQTFFQVYQVLTDLSGVLYFLSTAINPFLYSIMSNKFRDAFKITIAYRCCGRRHHMRRTTRCAERGRPSAQKRPPKRNRVPSTNTHLSTLTCTSKNIQMHHEDGTAACASGATGGPHQFNRSISGILIKNDIVKKTKRRIQEANAVARSNTSRLKCLRGKLRRGTRAMFNSKDNSVCLTSNREDDPDLARARETIARRESSESDKSSISNSSLQDMDDEEYTGHELATFMEQVNNNIA